MYGVDSDTNELMRYTFATDTYEIIAELRDEDGNGIDDVEAAAFIPQGPNKGMYCSPTKQCASVRRRRLRAT